jgi:hypothetical protein
MEEPFENAEGPSEKGIIRFVDLQHNKLSRLYFIGNRRTINRQEKIAGSYSLIFYNNSIGF